ncbi:MAG TPA: hypothetical protein VGF65_11165 [Mycobacterium sp.]|jgi:hypothetical protein
MHCLENMLLILAQRVRAGKDSPGVLALSVEMLANASHWYTPPLNDVLDRINDEWMQGR